MCYCRCGGYTTSLSMRRRHFVTSVQTLVSQLIHCMLTMQRQSTWLSLHWRGLVFCKLSRLLAQPDLPYHWRNQSPWFQRPFYANGIAFATLLSDNEFKAFLAHHVLSLSLNLCAFIFFVCFVLRHHIQLLWSWPATWKIWRVGESDCGWEESKNGEDRGKVSENVFLSIWC